MTFAFSKYHGAGNDFVLVDNRDGTFPSASVETVKTLCDRHFGIGADGLILLESSEVADFKMVYFNADGRLSSMCGNGARCIVLFASEKGIENVAGEFEAVDGIHSYLITEPNRKVKVSMRDVQEIVQRGATYFINTGSPHLIVPTEDIQDIDVREEGKKIRYSPQFKKEGVNVNFVQAQGDTVDIRTYERGVEDETLACGTGCVAAAAWAAVSQNVNGGTHTYRLNTLGGLVKVSFQHVGKRFKDVFLEGPAVKVFEGRATA